LVFLSVAAAATPRVLAIGRGKTERTGKQGSRGALQQKTGRMGKMD